MSKNNLKVVKSAKDKELENKEKNKALEAAISQITDNFGKGSVTVSYTHLTLPTTIAV